MSINSFIQYYAKVRHMKLTSKCKMNTYDSCSMQTKGPSHKNYGVLRNKISTELKSKE